MKRADLKKIQDLVPNGSRVLDLGCSDGQLLLQLLQQKQCRVQGIEQDQQAAIECIGRGIPVIQSDLSEGLSYFCDKSFDCIIISSTLQQLQQPQKLLKDALRAAPKVFVSIHNIGFWKHRLQLTFSGHMPRNSGLPYEWYNTPNIHLGTICDFKDMCSKEGFVIQNDFPLGASFASLRPNLLAPLCVFELKGN